MATVLIVDDDADIRDLIALKIESAGHDVYIESDGEAGIAAAELLRPDVMVVDWMMPRLSGLDVCRRVRAREELARTGLILLTAKGQEADVQRGFAAGADDYVVKPFSPRELVSRIQALLARVARPPVAAPAAPSEPRR
jgi:DNA-binding response OmpR family regulator